MKLNYAIKTNDYVYVGNDKHQTYKIPYNNVNSAFVLNNKIYINHIDYTNKLEFYPLIDEDEVWNNHFQWVDFKIISVEIIKDLIVKIACDKFNKVIDMKNYADDIGNFDKNDIKIINNSIGWGTEQEDYTICSDFIVIAPTYDEVKQFL